MTQSPDDPKFYDGRGVNKKPNRCRAFSPLTVGLGVGGTRRFRAGGRSCVVRFSGLFLVESVSDVLWAAVSERPRLANCSSKVGRHLKL